MQTREYPLSAARTPHAGRTTRVVSDGALDHTTYSISFAACREIWHGHEAHRSTVLYRYVTAAANYFWRPPRQIVSSASLLLLANG